MDLDGYKIESQVRLAAFVAIGLGIINLLVILGFITFITRGVTWILP